MADGTGRRAGPDGGRLPLPAAERRSHGPHDLYLPFQKILKENGLPQNLSVHSLRHTNASLLIAQGVDVRTVAGLLGHSQPSTTLDIYAHAFDKTKREAQEKLGKVMRL